MKKVSRSILLHSALSTVLVTIFISVLNTYTFIFFFERYKLREINNVMVDEIKLQRYPNSRKTGFDWQDKILE